jgi:hypothetical protein
VSCDSLPIVIPSARVAVIERMENPLIL